MSVIEVTDPLTGLEPFMLAAIGPGSDWEAIYQLLREFPAAIYRTYLPRPSTPHHSKRKRRNEPYLELSSVM
eukprot:CAMPEP_0198261572 /NCGR_PEP_ID=MMETSP1447-20131203/10271_1 /TAXON_ID=420782 /ORGANISM="Chaetoceros dichaeta, Strain CCMP1751" /LENGTH=71 /DNA_ID=CAMNT_0043949533 /DNA_START=1015 /DNA_END=1230 /DNA_ORIENTATION=-